MFDIDQARLILMRETLPSWEKDAALRREMLRLREEVAAYELTSSYSTRKAQQKLAQVQERTARVQRLIAGQRHGGGPGGGASLNRVRYD